MRLHHRAARSRLTALAALTSLLTSLLLALPTLSPAEAAPRPVPPRISHLALELPASGPGLLRAATQLPVTSPETATAPFMALGLTWDAAVPAAGEPSFEVRTRSGAGWSEWTEIDAAEEDGPDPAEADRAGRALRAGTAMLWTGPASAVQTRIQGGSHLRGLRLELIDPGTSPADEPRTRGAAHAGEARPGVITRSQWGADESLRRGDASYASTLKVGFIHHTASSSSYTSSQAAAQVRAIYAFHTQSRGWDDIGYNFLVDRFGRTYEGRAGGMDRPVIGAHTGGFNTSTFGVALLGTFDTTAPSATTQAALSRVMAWKLGLHHRNPLAKAQLSSGGGSTSRYPAGQLVTFNAISGHRDASSTACPGAATYARLPQIRSQVKQYLGAGFLEPSLSAAKFPFPASSLRVRAGSLTALSWTARLTRSCAPGVLVERSGSSLAGGRIDAELLLRDAAGAPLPPGSYQLTLTGRNGTDPAHAALLPFEIIPPAPVLPVQSGEPRAGEPAGFTAITPARLLDTRTGHGADAPYPIGASQRLDLQVTGRGGVPVGASSVVVNLTGVCPHSAASVTAWAADTPPPTATALSLEKGVTRAGLATVQLSPDGRISLRSTALTHLVVDVVGYASPLASAEFHPLTPRRVLDTRLTASPLTPDELRRLTLAGAEHSGVPAAATAVAVNLTVVPRRPGHLTAYPGGERPLASSLNFRTSPVANRAIIGLQERGITLSASTDTHVIVDVVGYYAPRLDASAPAGTTLTTIPSARLLDTRAGVGAPKGRLTRAQVLTLSLAGRGGIPADARGVVLSLTGSATRRTHLTAYPAGSPLPGSSDLNLTAYEPGTNLVLVPLGDGMISLRDAAGSSHLTADVVGFYR